MPKVRKSFAEKLLFQKIQQSQSRQGEQCQEIPNRVVVAASDAACKGNVLIEDIEKVLLGQL